MEFSKLGCGKRSEWEPFNLKVINWTFWYNNNREDAESDE